MCVRAQFLCHRRVTSQWSNSLRCDNDQRIWIERRRGAKLSEKPTGLHSPGQILERETKDRFCNERNRLSKRVCEHVREIEREWKRDEYDCLHIPSGHFLWRLCTSSNREKCLCTPAHSQISHWCKKKSDRAISLQFKVLHFKWIIDILCEARPFTH